MIHAVTLLASSTQDAQETVLQAQNFQSEPGQEMQADSESDFFFEHLSALAFEHAP